LPDVRPKSTTVSNLLFNVRNNGTFWDGAQRQDVANCQACVLAGVDELTSVHALVGDEGLGVELESVRVTEDDFGERSTTARIVDYILHNPSNIAMSFGVVE
jgi:hypothetical protein